MIDYKNTIIEWLSRDFVGRNLKNVSIDQHVDVILNMEDERENYETFIKEGCKLLKSLIDVCKRNNLLGEFIPVFRITLRNVKRIEKIDIISMGDVIKRIDMTPPELCLYRKNLGYEETHTIEEYNYPITNSYFNEIFRKNYYIVCSIYKSEEDITNGWDYYNRLITIKYNENDTEKSDNSYFKELPNLRL